MKELDFLASIEVKDEDQRESYGADQSGWPAQLPSRVFRPKNTQQVADLLKEASLQKQKVTIQGGLTGLAGSACPDKGDWVINMSQMNQMESLDELGGVVIVQAGMVLEKLCQEVQSKGWYFPLDFGARGSCQIGGNVATNAGGNKVFKYGNTRELVLGLEVVLPDGTVLDMLNQTLKNNTGLDLKHLFIGTEGRYGVITRVALRLFPLPTARQSALVAADSLSSILKLLKKGRSELPNLSSFEVMWDSYLKHSAKVLKVECPFEGKAPIVVLMELEGKEETLNHQLTQFLEEAFEEGMVKDVILPQTIEQSKKLWQLRDAIGELLGQIKEYVAFDIAIPIKDMEQFIASSEKVLHERFGHALVMLFGHLGDCNLHLTVGKLACDELEAVEIAVYEIVAQYRGSITAEHGIGRIKKPFLSYSRSTDQITLMQKWRQIINPENILNAGRVID